MRPGETIEAPALGHRIVCLDDTAGTGGALLRFDFWMRAGAAALPVHLHPHQEERNVVKHGYVRCVTAGAVRVLGPGDEVVTPPGVPHTIGPADQHELEVTIEYRPALGFEHFLERTFALDRAGHVSARGLGNPLRLATAKPHEAEFFVPRVPIALQRAALGALERLGRRLAD